MWLGVLGGASTAFLAAAWPLGGKEQPSKPLRHHTADGADRNFVCAIFGGDLGLCGLVVALMLREIMVFLLFFFVVVVVVVVVWTLTRRR